jgi:hypothetical protein
MASDIYSFGMIMWELITGRMPFWNQDNDIELMIKICKNFRPPIIKDTPKGYTELMQECWNSDLSKRPTTSSILKKLFYIKRVEEENPTKIIKPLDIGPITTNKSDKSRSLSKMINYIRSSKSSKIIIDSKNNESLGNYFLAFF